LTHHERVRACMTAQGKHGRQAECALERCAHSAGVCCGMFVRVAHHRFYLLCCVVARCTVERCVGLLGCALYAVRCTSYGRAECALERFAASALPLRVRVVENELGGQLVLLEVHLAADDVHQGSRVDEDRVLVCTPIKATGCAMLRRAAHQRVGICCTKTDEDRMLVCTQPSTARIRCRSDRVRPHALPCYAHRTTWRG
jgi:hypothetical protein